MVVIRLFSVLVLTSILSGCACYICRLPENIDNLRSDVKLLKAYLKAKPVDSVCATPGTPQSAICNYTLVVKRIEGNLYRGYIAPEAVGSGVEACKKFVSELKNDKDAEWMLNDYAACVEKDDYKYVWYAFTMEDDKFEPKENTAENFHNLPNTNFLRKGAVDLEPPVVKTVSK